jgi:arylsulfatase A-like enzyme
MPEATSTGHGHGKPPSHGHKPPSCPPAGGVDLPPGVPELPEVPIDKEHPPNILVIFGDDIGLANISAYNQGLCGYRTPSIDRIAREGVLFTDAYADQSCTAGRSSFILGQSPIRTGLTRVGLPGDLFGISPNDPTLANLLVDHGYACGQFGKNHLGDRDWHLPTRHGFDVFFGNLYHLNAEEEPENPDYPEHPAYPGPRGVLRCERQGNGQTIEDTGPLSSARMPGIDDEFAGAAMAWITAKQTAGTPWFCWFNSSRMHVWTRLKADSEGTTGLGLYPDGMVEHDNHVGQLLDLLDELDAADNTIVVYSTDNGAEVFTFPDGGTTPFRAEKGSNYEGGYRVPMMARWPGHFPAGAQCNGITSMLDWLPTLMAAVGEPEIRRDLITGKVADGRPWRAHLDGYNLLDNLMGRRVPWPRREFFYITDDGRISALRYEQWKFLVLEQRAEGFASWADPPIELRMPKITNLRSDPYERAQAESGAYEEWFMRRGFLFAGAGLIVAAFAATLAEFPPRPSEEGAFVHEGETSPLVAAFEGGADDLARLERLFATAYAD